MIRTNDKLQINDLEILISLIVPISIGFYINHGEKIN